MPRDKCLLIAGGFRYDMYDGVWKPNHLLPDASRTRHVASQFRKMVSLACFHLLCSAGCSEAFRIRQSATTGDVFACLLGAAVKLLDERGCQRQTNIACRASVVGSHTYLYQLDPTALLHNVHNVVPQLNHELSVWGPSGSEVVNCT